MKPEGEDADKDEFAVPPKVGAPSCCVDAVMVVYNMRAHYVCFGGGNWKSTIISYPGPTSIYYIVVVPSPPRYKLGSHPCTWWTSVWARVGLDRCFSASVQLGEQAPVTQNLSRYGCLFPCCIVCLYCMPVLYACDVCMVQPQYTGGNKI